MITDNYHDDPRLIPADVVLLPVDPGGIISECKDYGYDEIYPELGVRVRQMVQTNDFKEGMLCIIPASNVAGTRLIIGMPVRPHQQETIQKRYLTRGMIALTGLLLQNPELETVVIPMDGFRAASEAAGFRVDLRVHTHLSTIDITLERPISIQLVHADILKVKV